MTESDNTPLLKVENLRKYFTVKDGRLFGSGKKLMAVDDVSFEIFAGETVGFVGESGCGKSTLGKAVLRLIEPTAGCVSFGGLDLLALNRKELREIRKDIQIIFQDPYESLNPRLTIGEILEEPFVIHKLGNAAERKIKVAELLKKVGLPETAINRFPHEFSGGQRQRIGIARAIALKPRLIICDEPVSALDVSVQSQILNLLLDLQKEMNLALVFIAHDLAVVKHISDRIAVMYLGKIVEFGKAADIYANPQHPYTEALISAIPIPDPFAEKNKKPLAGEIPSPADPPSGCYFHTRCPYVQEQCKNEMPELIPNGKNSLVACHFSLSSLQETS